MSNTSMTGSFSAPIVQIINDKEVHFKKLSVNEVAEFISLLKAKWVNDAKKLVNECEIKGLEKYKVLKNAEEVEPLITDLWVYAQTIEGAQRVVRKSLQKSGNENVDEVVQFMDIQDLIKMALQVTGYIFESDKPEPSKKTEVPQEPLGFIK